MRGSERPKLVAKPQPHTFVYAPHKQGEDQGNRGSSQGLTRCERAPSSPLVPSTFFVLATAV
eukprot:5974075-Amphidinium_carterae.1